MIIYVQKYNEVLQSILYIVYFHTWMIVKCGMDWIFLTVLQITLHTIIFKLITSWYQ